MRKILNSSILNLAARIILGSIFLFAAVSKIADPATFAEEIANYQILPNFAINIAAIIFPWVELVCGIFVITGLRLRATSATLGALTFIFTIAIAIAVAKGLNINCGCHTQVTAEKIGLQKILENIGLIILSALIYFSKGKKFTLERVIIINSLRNRFFAREN